MVIICVSWNYLTQTGFVFFCITKMYGCYYGKNIQWNIYKMHSCHIDSVAIVHVLHFNASLRKCAMALLKTYIYLVEKKSEGSEKNVSKPLNITFPRPLWSSILNEKHFVTLKSLALDSTYLCNMPSFHEEVHCESIMRVTLIRLSFIMVVLRFNTLWNLGLYFCMSTAASSNKHSLFANDGILLLFMFCRGPLTVLESGL